MGSVVLASSVIGSIVGCYILLRLLMYGVRKVRRQPNGALEIALLGLFLLAVATVVGGYGKRDDLPEPQFIQAFYTYFGPAMLVAVIELVRLDRRNSDPPPENT